MKKIRVIIVTMVIALSLLFALPLRQAKAATLPSAVFSDEGGGMVFVSVADLGMFIVNEWEIVVKSDWPAMVSPFAIGMRFYNPTWNEFGIIILSDDNWFGHGIFGDWADPTSGYYSITHGGQGVWTISTAPPDAASASNSAADTVR